MNGQQFMESCAAAIAERGLVARQWHIDRIENDYGFMPMIEISFTFMCPCGRDIREHLRIPVPAKPDDNLWSHILEQSKRTLIAELANHLKEEA